MGPSGCSPTWQLEEARHLHHHRVASRAAAQRVREAPGGAEARDGGVGLKEMDGSQLHLGPGLGNPSAHESLLSRQKRGGPHPKVSNILFVT